ncbi:protein of unknown function [Sterolibacterium denitrificans]|uniref:GspL cytoplasmic actin-ATPase-like domain-containing protein n=1 Tax=Sterolibacterium denitrificans TaxID=157592 RepID=A0A7Z7HS38_9PROT|nr:hypothetical protein [Sterolibacterium denitrificans]SMB24246.1 protein of unknown function [Sterolibacterium denitrificans]
MSILLHFTMHGARYWQHRKHGWQPCDEPPRTNDPVWVLTDLAGESFVDVEVPPLHGRDRRDLIERQLAAHFPDTTWRTALRVRSAERRQRHAVPAAPMATMRCLLFGISDGKKLDAELDARNVSIAALNATSLLLAGIGQDPQLPAELFIVLPEPSGLRIVFLQHHRPLLTRLAPWQAQAETQTQTLVEEIGRTCRHLESAHILPRDQQAAATPPLLILGRQAEHAELETALAAANYTLLASPAAWQRLQDNSDRPLFDLAMRKQPFGQLAPLARRRHHLAARLRKPALAASLLLAMAGTAATAGNFMEYRQLQQRLAEQQATLQQLNAAIAMLDQQHADLETNPALLHQTIRLHARELAAPPSFARYLHALAAILDEPGQVPLRLNRLEWRLPDGQASLCATSMPAADTPNQERLAEVNITMQLPEARPASSRAATLQGISSRLARLPGTRLVVDPARALAHATLQGDTQADNREPHANWCLALVAGEPLEPAEAGDTNAANAADQQP